MRADCGWGTVTEEAAVRALRASVVSVTCRSGLDLVAMARVVGDGVLYFYVQDVIVRPEWRGRSIGGRMMDIVLGRVRGMAAQGATIGLMAVAGREGFYERFGFQVRPTSGSGRAMRAGMTQSLLE